MANYSGPFPVDPLWYRRDCYLRARCACGHAVAVRLGDLEARHRLGRETRLYEVHARLRCSRCGAGPPEQWDVADRAGPVGMK